MSRSIYTYSNNGVIGVVSESSALKLDRITEIVNELYQAAYAKSAGAYIDTTPFYEIARGEVGRIPIASFVRDEYIDSYKPYVTGTHTEYDKLSSICSVRSKSFWVPFSNGDVQQYSREENLPSCVSLTELVEIFGIEGVAGLAENDYGKLATTAS